MDGRGWLCQAALGRSLSIMYTWPHIAVRIDTGPLPSPMDGGHHQVLVLEDLILEGYIAGLYYKQGA